MVSTDLRTSKEESESSNHTPNASKPCVYQYIFLFILQHHVIVRFPMMLKSDHPIPHGEVWTQHAELLHSYNCLKWSENRLPWNEFTYKNQNTVHMPTTLTCQSSWTQLCVTLRQWQQSRLCVACWTFCPSALRGCRSTLRRWKIWQQRRPPQTQHACWLAQVQWSAGWLSTAPLSVREIARGDWGIDGQSSTVLNIISWMYQHADWLVLQSGHT